MRVLALASGLWEKSIKEFADPSKTLLEVHVEPPAETRSQIESGFLKNDVILLGPEVRDVPPVDWTKVPLDVNRLHCFDTYLKQEGIWWPRCFLFPALLETLVSDVGSVDTRAKALVVGLGRESRIVIGLLSQLGFRHIQIVLSEGLPQGSTDVQDLRQTYFGVTFEFLEPAALLLQPGHTSLVCNTLKTEESPAFVMDLSYFNFLRPNGIIIDLSYDESSNSFLEEGKAMGAKLVSTEKILRRYHQYWWKALQP